MRRLLALAAIAVSAAAGVVTAPAAARAATPCVRTTHHGACGPYTDPADLTWSNGHNTFVIQDMWACDSPGAYPCGPQALTAYGPGHWQAVSTQNAPTTATRTYPNVQQFLRNWRTGQPTPVAAFGAIVSTFTENMHPQAGTIAEAGYDIWLKGNAANTPREVMIWPDNHGRGYGGARWKAHAVIYGQGWTILEYGTGEVVVSLDHNEQTGTVHILATLGWLTGHRFISPGAALDSIDFGWEICSTGNQPELFTVSGYTLKTPCVTSGCMN